MANKRKILIFYDYFAPAYKAGGPIRSLVNLVKLLEQDLFVYVVSTNIDHDGMELNVEANTWQDYDRSSQVMYLYSRKRKIDTIAAIISDIKPDVVYLNGMFSLIFQVYPLWCLRKVKGIKVVLSPRGMLQKEPLSIKPIKKWIYLKILRSLLVKGVNTWHVTTEQELNDLREFTGKNANVIEIGNVPSYQNDIDITLSKARETKVLGTIALISPMKNIHLILEALAKVTYDVSYGIYGPIKDTEYWNACLELIDKLPSNIDFTYDGEIKPDTVPDVIKSMDFYIQPSKSENFGHSIFEAFNQGVPVIISDQTPWKGLRVKKAGWDVDLNVQDELQHTIEDALSMDKSSYMEFRKGARGVAEDYMEKHDFRKAYNDLFS